MIRITFALMVCGVLAMLAGCGQPENMGAFEQDVNAVYNGNEMSRSRNEPGYVPHYNTTSIAQ